MTIGRVFPNSPCPDILHHSKANKYDVFLELFGFNVSLYNFVHNPPVLMNDWPFSVWCFS